MKSFCLFVCFFVSIYVYAQEDNLYIRNYDITKFPSKYIECITRDSIGFLWFGTYDGLIRFDGVEYKQFTSDASKTNTIDENHIHDIVQDVDNQLWIATTRGVSIYNPIREVFYNFNFDTVHQPFKNKNISKICILKSHVWIATEKGLYVYNKETKHTKIIDTVLACNTVFHHNSNIYVGTEGKGIYVYDVQSMKREMHIVSSEWKSLLPIHNSIMDIDIDTKGNVWFVTVNNGFYTFNLHEKKLISRTLPLPNNTLLLSLHVEDEKNYLIGTMNGGLLVCKNGIQYTFTNQDETNLYIPANTVKAIYKDENNTIWFGSHLAGFFSYSLQKGSVEYFKHKKGVKESLSHSIVSCFEESDNYIWVGTDGGGVTVYTKDMKVVRHINTSNGLITNAVTDIVYDNETYMYIAQWGGGVVRCNVHSFECNSITQSFLAHSRFESLLDIKGMYLDSRKRLWIAPHMSPVYIYDVKTKQIFSKQNPGIFPNELFNHIKLTGITQDVDSSIWLYGYEGIYKYSNNSVTVFRNNEPASPIYRFGNIIYMYSDKETKRIWICSDKGLFYYSHLYKTFKAFKPYYEFPKKFFFISKDSNNIYWYTSNNGVGNFNLSTFSYNQFLPEIDLPGNSYYDKAGFIKSDNKILLGTLFGFVMFSPKQSNPIKSKSRVIITDFKIFNESISALYNPEIISKSISYCDTIFLEHYHKTFSFVIRDLQMPHTKNQTILYTLKGYDNSWNTLFGSNTITYTNLAPGNYTLYVADNENTIYKTLHIIISPPWYKTMWFIISFISINVCSLVLIIYFRAKKIRLERLHLQKEVAKKTKHLQVKNEILIEKNELIALQKEHLEQKNSKLETQNSYILTQQTELITTSKQLHELIKTKDRLISIISHDIKNPLHTIINFSNLSTKTNKIDDLKQYNSYIHAASEDMNELLTNLLVWYRNQENSQLFTGASCNVADMIQNTTQLYSHMIAIRTIELIEDYSEQIIAYGDFNMLDVVIRNCINNALKYTRDKGKVYISQTNTCGFCIIYILDTGYGMAQELIDSLHNYSETDAKHTIITSGFGLQICKDLIQKNRGVIHFSSEKNKGTLCTIVLHQTLESFNNCDIEIDLVLENDFESIYETCLTYEKPTLHVDIETQVIDFGILRNKTILIVEDDEIQCSFLVDSFGSVCKIHVAKNGLEGIEMAKQFVPDIIISDVTMPQMNGIEMCKHIKSMLEVSHIPIILLSIENTTHDQLQGYSSGAIAYIGKPFSLEQLVSVIKNILEYQNIQKEKFKKSLSIESQEHIINIVDKEFINSVVDIIEKNLQNPQLNPDFLIDTFGISRSLFYAKIKQLTDLGVSEFIRLIRLKKSIPLLEQGILTISEIAYEVGFNSVSYYTRSFKKEFGEAPSKFATNF